SGAEGVALYHQELPEIVITDLRMPEMTGQDVLQAIRAHDPEANVILTSGHGDQEAILEAMRAGASDFLPKPVDQVTLESALRRAAERVHLKRELRASQEALREQNARLEEEVAKRTAALRQTTRRFQALLDHSPALVHIFDEEGRYLLVGEATAEAMGLAREEIIGKTFADLLSPETVATFMHRVERLKESRAELFVEDQITVNGEEQFFESLLFPLSEENGGSIYASIAIDVTQRKQAEQALRESEKQFRALVEGAPEAIFVQTEHRFAYLNPAAVRLFGAETADQLIGQPVLDRFHPSVRDQVQQRIHALNQEKRDVPILEEIYLRMDGSPVDVEVVAVPITYEGQDGALVFVRDITERKQSVAALQHWQELMEFIIKHDPNAIAVLDKDLRFKFVSDRFVRDYGVEEVDIIGRHHYEVFPEIPEKWREIHRRVLNGEIMRAEEDHFIRPDGTPDWTRWECRPWYLADQTIGGLILYTEVITERKRMEAALRESESRVKHKLKSILSPAGDLSSLDLVDIIDVEAIQSLMDHFYGLTHIGIAIVNMEGEVLVATGWQDICTKFHRVHPKTRQYCIESDTVLSTDITPGDHKLYKCKNNMWDMATPIVVGGRHVGNLFLGQFFFDDETVDREAFRQQAEAYGFDEEAYLTALDRVPRWSREKVRTVFRFYTELATLISQLSHSNLNLAQSLTEKKRLIAELKESEQAFKSYIEHAPYGVFVADAQGRYVEVNAAACKMTGYERDELLNMQIVHLSPPEHRETVEEHFRTVVAEGGATGVAPFIRKDGSLRWWSIVAVRLTDTRFLGYTEDVTERKRAEEERARLTAEVRTQAKQMAQILATVPAGVLLMDATGRVLQANTVAKDDLAVLVGGAVGDTLTRLGDRPLFELLTSPPIKGLWHEVEADDRTFEILARPVENGSVPEQWVLVINDVTEERQIRAQNQQQAQLAAVGQLAAGIAHDFNNIMAVIVLYTQMGLRMPDVPPKLRARLEVVSQQAQRATDLIQQILDFGRQAVLERQPIDLASFLKEVVKLLERTLPENIKVKLNFGQGEYTINADPTRMQQAIMNLAINARDAMRPQGGGELRIDVSRMTAPYSIRCVTCGQMLDGDNGDNG
ncbi:MAG: PAS domain S-box protein, partial [Anaerolineales bacterium]